MLDFNVLRYGEVFTLDPLTEEARTWMHYNLENPVQWGSGVVLDGDEALTLVETLLKEGYSINDENLPF